LRVNDATQVELEKRESTNQEIAGNDEQKLSVLFCSVAGV
jgi:hypothetical protein